MIDLRRLAPLRLFLRRCGLTLLLATWLLRLEGLRVVREAAAELVGGWESNLLLAGVPALGLLVALPLVLVVVGYATLVPIVARRRGRLAWGAAAAIVAGALAVDLTTGRKAHVPSFRVPFVTGCAVVAAGLCWALLPAWHRLARRRPWTTPALGAALGLVAFVADQRVLPRLYLPLHLAFVGALVVATAMLAEGVADLARLGPRAELVVDLVALLGLWQPNTARGRMRWAGESLARYDNARRIVDERSPVLGRVAALAARRWPPRPLDLDADPDGGAAPDPLAQLESRALRANGRDVLLVTIDALRADHVGAYGYGRPTTPAIDALAAEGTLFERAYTPAPHTSYAIASLMTGKYMRPIFALQAATGGVRRPDETWAYLLRSYGFRTAAFYPPAVFTVDGERFADLAGRGLDFEYAKIEFAAPDLRAAQVRDYLAAAPRDKPLFVWVHLFEPHEPYVAHPEHAFGDAELDRYDSEIATADDGVGAIAAAFRASRPGAMVIVTADHGEAFGEHGARYHGTTVFEEQVRVPLVVSAPGLVAARRVDRPVQLVDLLPTLLSAYGIPRPPRVRGRDLGALLAPSAPPGSPPSALPVGDGLAFAEVDDAKLLAVGTRRLICTLHVATCALYDLAEDPGQTHPRLGPAADAEIAALRRAMGGLLAESGRLEGLATGAAAGWPEPLRRALAGDADAALEVAPLLDDVDVSYRRRAARALAQLARPETAVHVARALDRERDETTRAWLSIARVRLLPDGGAPGPELAISLVRLVDATADATTDAEQRRFAALAIADAMRTRSLPFAPPTRARAFAVLAGWLPDARQDADRARGIVAGLIALHVPEVAPRATRALLDALDDVRLRREAVRALGLLGDHAAAPALVDRLSRERHLDMRAAEALALARIGDRAQALIWFTRVLGVPEPAVGGADALAEALGEGPPVSWAVLARPPAAHVDVGLHVPGGFLHRLLVAGPPAGTRLHVRLGAGPTLDAVAGDAGGVVELGDGIRGSVGGVVQIHVDVDAGLVTAVAIVTRVGDLPAPKPDRALEDGPADAGP